MTNDNPILNNSYAEPELHYATDPEGELDYENATRDARNDIREKTSTSALA